MSNSRRIILYFFASSLVLGGNCTYAAQNNNPNVPTQKKVLHRGDPDYLKPVVVLPADLPVEIIPKATLLQAYETKTPKDKKGFYVRYKVALDADAILEFYKSSLASAGWTVDKIRTEINPARIEFAAKKKYMSAGVTIVPKPKSKYGTLSHVLLTISNW